MSNGFTILLIEDDAEDQLLFRRFLPSGYRLVTLDGPDAVMQKIRSEEVDIVYVDYRLGATSGLDLVAELRAEGLKLPIVVVTGQDIDTLGENALLAGATDFVRKSELSREILTRVTRWAMIRCRAEKRAAPMISAGALAELLGHMPSPEIAGDCPSLRRVVYLSRAKHALTQQEVLSLCAQAASRNARESITGALLCAGNCFLQVIEGPDAAILGLVDRLQRDERHTDLSIIVDEGIRRRDFARWSMGAHFVDLQFKFTPVAWMRVVDALSYAVAESGGSAGRISAQRLISALPQLLNAHRSRSAASTL